MYSTASQAQADLTRLFWDGYRHGISGLPRTRFAGYCAQSSRYDEGYDAGLQVYEDTKVERDPTATTQPREAINQVLALRNRIDQHHKEINDFESQIRRLESGA